MNQASATAIQYEANLMEQLDFNKGDGLLPAIVQDVISGQVLMQAYINRDALAQTLASGKVTFYSRSRQQLWVKGESSGNFLDAVSISADCDNDSLLIMAQPVGPTCHTGATSCWHTEYSKPFTNQLSALIHRRKLAMASADESQSYTSALFASGSKRIAQKVGEEGVETALAGATGDSQELVNEAADLLFHLMVLLEDQQLSLEDVQQRLYQRHQEQ
ncbi:bifunctional phosphoribosyl-AMP cyclohydrolase/phosphoribosyl-ATP diphosphatase HisIE [Shewanella sp. NIFS-20-20]|uniref:bifunctional phosphoribosyl-AMP cyclohydrolase/phosphoribosyl-ATP diphosphatase HisIE n=1 Tax=Shewanella sp. NIFS-20-20 TaxID=2853806 RepID=UPI001C4370D2|nr:bifunctional phosphoribosyl-AMP cyclohydrolase/phosphoribosyl-ATP diphosphatase HisIE [Shewanella sp. NIFS-20-20]MBV7314396.1 bifunctional phosphoribosyl-AMP cyclohydrolase/phosphoribosyl-ATP diphosphatase HisIE [Shewanella sp. NIFS-20-20]